MGTKMADYTSTEIQSAVSKVVRTSVRFPYDNLGTRNTDTTFTDLQDAAAGVFISFDSTPYYLARLAANRLEELVQAMSEAIDDFIDTARAAARKVTPVERLSSLVQARIACDALAGASNTRTGSFQDITQVPAYRRFETNTSVFLREEGKKVKSGGVIVKTPQEAQGQLRGMAVSLREQHTEVTRRAGLLRDCISDYEGMNLPAQFSSTILNNSSSVLQARVDELSALSPQDRLDVLRDVTLDVLTTRSAVRGFSSLGAPTMFVVLHGTGEMSDYFPGVAASLQADNYEGYNFYSGQSNIDLVVDSAGSSTATVTIQMTGAFVPFLNTLKANPITLVAANDFLIKLTSYADETVSVPIGTYEMYELAAAINADISAAPVEAIMRFINTRTTAACTAVLVSPGVYDLWLVAPTTPLPMTYPPFTWVQLGVLLTDLAVVLGSEVVLQPTTFLNYDLTLRCSVVQGTMGVGDVDVSVGLPASQYLSIRVKYSAGNNALNGEWILKLEDVTAGSLAQLGYTSGMEAKARQVRAKDVVEALNKSSSTLDLNARPRLRAAEQFDAIYWSGKARTDPSSPVKLVIYQGRGEATISAITVVNPSTSEVTFDLDSSGDWADVEVAGKLVIRESENIPDMNKAMTITYVSSSQIKAHVLTVDAPALLTVLIETGPASLSSGPTSKPFTRVIVDESSMLDGVYETERYDNSTPLVLNLRSPLVNYRDVGGLPIFVSSLRWGLTRVVLTSRSTALDSYVKALNTAVADASFVLFTLPAEAYGTTKWYQLPSSTTKVEVGDTLEFYNYSATVPDVVVTIESVDTSLNLLGVSPVLSMGQANVPFDVDSQVPFGRVRKQKKQNFSTMEGSLATWLSRDEADPLLYFRQLDSVLNPVVSNLNPTYGQVNGLVSQLQDLKNALVSGSSSLLSATSSYSVSPVEQADALIKSYLDQGADRAVDLLLEGQFSTFFGLSMAGASYAGRLQETIQATSRDLPIRKTGRLTQASMASTQMVASYEDVDYEYTPEDIDPSDRVDIPETSVPFGGSLPVP